MLTDVEKKEHLAKVLAPYAFVHCNGCDGWCCDHVSGEDAKLLEEMVNDVWQEISSWSERDNGQGNGA